MNLVDNYLRKKELGLVEVIKAGGGFALASKRFSQETGEELKPEIVAVDIDELISTKEKLLLDIAGIDTLIADLQNKE